MKKTGLIFRGMIVPEVRSPLGEAARTLLVVPVINSVALDSHYYKPFHRIFEAVPLGCLSLYQVEVLELHIPASRSQPH
jgi:hypothetical protein